VRDGAEVAPPGALFLDVPHYADHMDRLAVETENLSHGLLSFEILTDERFIDYGDRV
jgi:hypothetical protein